MRTFYFDDESVDVDYKWELIWFCEEMEILMRSLKSDENFKKKKVKKSWKKWKFKKKNEELKINVKTPYKVARKIIVEKNSNIYSHQHEINISVRLLQRT